MNDDLEILLFPETGEDSLFYTEKIKELMEHSIINKHSFVMDGRLIRGYGKTKILADLSAKYNIFDIVQIKGMKKYAKDRNDNAKTIDIQSFKKIPLTFDEEVLLVDELTREQIKPLIRMGYTVVGFVWR